MRVSMLLLHSLPSFVDASCYSSKALMCVCMRVCVLQTFCACSRLSSRFLEFISNSKSGQFFFFTHDQQYMIKTQTKAECKFLRSILPQYYRVRRSPSTSCPFPSPSLSLALSLSLHMRTCSVSLICTHISLTHIWFQQYCFVSWSLLCMYVCMYVWMCEYA
jgi:hypothetical protein